MKKIMSGNKVKEVLSKPINGNQIYLASLVFYLFFSFLRNTTFNPYLGSRVFNLASYVVVAALLFKVLVCDPHTKGQFWSLILMLFAIISWRFSTSNLILVMMAFIIAAKDVPFRQIIKYYFYVTLILLLSVICFSLLGVIKDLVFVVQGRAVRYSLGIVYPTDLAAHVLYLILAHAYLNYRKLNWKYYCSYLVIAAVLKFVTDARLSILCIIVTVPVLMIAKLSENPKHKISHFVLCCYWALIPLLAFISFAGTYFFDNTNHIYYEIDHLLSGRLSYGLMAMYRYHPITTFGQKVVENGLGGSKGLSVFHNANVGYFYIDSSYLRLIIIYGAIVALIILSIMVAISLKGVFNHNYAITAIILVVTLSCFVEQHLLELSYNPFLLALLASFNVKGSEEFKIARKKV